MTSEREDIREWIAHMLTRCTDEQCEQLSRAIEGQLGLERVASLRLSFAQAQEEEAADLTHDIQPVPTDGKITSAAQARKAAESWDVDSIRFTLSSPSKMIGAQAGDELLLRRVGPMPGSAHHCKKGDWMERVFFFVKHAQWKGQDYHHQRREHFDLGWDQERLIIGRLKFRGHHRCIFDVDGKDVEVCHKWQRYSMEREHYLVFEILSVRPGSNDRDWMADSEFVNTMQHVMNGEAIR